MKVYRIGTKYVDLDHIVAIGEPYKYSDECSGLLFCIPVKYMFAGDDKIKLPINVPVEFGKDKDAWVETQFGEPTLKYSNDFVERISTEFRLMKYNIWAPFLKAWENKDLKTEETTVE